MHKTTFSDGIDEYEVEFEVIPYVRHSRETYEHFGFITHRNIPDWMFALGSFHVVGYEDKSLDHLARHAALEWIDEHHQELIEHYAS